MSEATRSSAAPGTGEVNVLTARGSIDPSAAVTELRLEDGRTVQFSTAALLRSEAPSHTSSSLPDAAQLAGPESGTGSIVLPLVEERLDISRRVVETGKVRLHKHVHEYETQLDEVLAVRSFDVERVVVNQPVEAPPAVRQEGDTTVYPLVEEQLVITRQLVLREELRVTRRDSERHDTRPVTLRREIIDVEREPLTTTPPDKTS